LELVGYLGPSNVRAVSRKIDPFPWWLLADPSSPGFIHISALVFAILSAFWVIKAIVGLFKSGRGVTAILHDSTDPERAPLVGN
jgi:hypothetical protein